MTIEELKKFLKEELAIEIKRAEFSPEELKVQLRFWGEDPFTEDSVYIRELDREV